jgi:hypothetical protein
MGLSQRTRTALGIGKGGKIDFTKAKAVPANLKLKTLGESNDPLYHDPIRAIGMLRDGLYDFTQMQQKNPSETKVRVVLGPKNYAILTEAEIRQRLREKEKIAQSGIDSEYYKTQIAFTLIKRVAMMREFLNEPDEGDPLLKKQKELFAFYRACELRPVIPELIGSNRPPNNLKEIKGTAAPATKSR